MNRFFILVAFFSLCNRAYNLPLGSKIAVNGRGALYEQAHAQQRSLSPL
jgi:hypothetical protein